MAGGHPGRFTVATYRHPIPADEHHRPRERGNSRHRGQSPGAHGCPGRSTTHMAIATTRSSHHFTAQYGCREYTRGHSRLATCHQSASHSTFKPQSAEKNRHSKPTQENNSLIQEYRAPFAALSCRLRPDREFSFDRTSRRSLARHSGAQGRALYGGRVAGGSRSERGPVCDDVGARWVSHQGRSRCDSRGTLALSVAPRRPGTPSCRIDAPLGWLHELLHQLGQIA
jgi:hypothetical protein